MTTINQLFRYMKNLNNVTEEEILYYLMVWCSSYVEDDFKKAFKNSEIGYKFYWSKLEKLIENKKSIIQLVIKMDVEHHQMLLDYLFNEKYKKALEERRKMFEQPK